MLVYKGFTDVSSNIGNEDFVVPATPTNAFVGGMPAKRTASGLTLATQYNASNHVVGLFRYSEATFIADANGFTVSVKATYIRNAVGVGISEGTEKQTQRADTMCPYDKSKTYAIEDLLYVNVTTYQLTNASGDAGGSPLPIGKVVEPPSDASSGTEMLIQVFGDLL